MPPLANDSPGDAGETGKKPSPPGKRPNVPHGPPANDHRTGNQQEALIAESIKRLFPGVSVKYGRKPRAWVDTRFNLPVEAAGRKAGVKAAAAETDFWYADSSATVQFFEITRPGAEITKGEQLLLKSLPKAVEHMLLPSATDAIDTARRLAGRLSFEHVLVTRYLRRTNTGAMWTPYLMLTLLQDLTFAKYEGAPCTSGFVFTSQPREYVRQIDPDFVQFNQFPQPLGLALDHFKSPAAFRYVDGRNSFYLIDNFQVIHGTLQLKRPSRFSIIDRCTDSHVEPLVRSKPGRTWAGFVGLGADVRVVTQGGDRLTWRENHWRMRDRELLDRPLREFGCEEVFANVLTSVLLSLSELHMGCVVLIASDPIKRPVVAGSIDHSDVGEQLRIGLKGLTIQNLVETHSVLSVLSSDGLTTIGKRGEIIAVGEIIDISAAAKSNMAGGGRTQAAIAAGKFGLAIKVSEDGPISIFNSTGQLLKF